MRRIAQAALVFICAVFCTFAQTAPQSTPETSSQSWSWFSEAGAASNNNLLGGLGIAMDAGANQQIFGEIALQTGSAPGQSSMLLIGVKSNYPSITRQGRKFTPFSIVGFGASIDSLAKKQISPPSMLGLNASTVTTIGTSAGLAEQYAAGVETAIGSWNVGIGMSGDKTGSGWKGHPFVFLSRELGKPASAK